MNFHKFYQYARSCLILHHFECYWYKCSSNINLQFVILLLWYSSQNSENELSLDPFENHLDATVIFFQILNWGLDKSDLKESGRTSTMNHPKGGNSDLHGSFLIASKKVLSNGQVSILV